MDTGIFLDLFRQALDQVEQVYYGTAWWNASMLNPYQDLVDNPQRMILEDYWERYDERVFCYELYHQVRAHIEAYEAEHPEDLSPLLFQGELRKEQISDIVAEYFQVQRLEKAYIPDFLLHSPGDFQHQSLIIEVKSAPNLPFGSIQQDLAKIQEFISRYRYQMGLFLVVNTPAERMRAMLSHPEHQEWMAEHLPNRSQIKFMCKHDHQASLFECSLNEVPASLC
ncbi:MAG TPA: hypothetical protein VKR06_12025 [Ktedonosporobacter sp.]|nr:hypothetical protein [Ktedonosporobacter sp.]